MDDEFKKFCSELFKHENVSTEDFYKVWAEKYEDVMGTTYTAAVNATAAQGLAKHVGDVATASILDVPCGSGLTGQALVNAGFKNINGVDLSPDMLKLAAEKNNHSKLSIGKISHDTKLEFPDQSYDGVICVFGLDNIHLDYTCALKEFLRLLKPNGFMTYHISLRVYKLTELLQYHMDLMKDGLMDMVLMEKQSYYEVDGEKMYSLFCIMKKL